VDNGGTDWLTPAATLAAVFVGGGLTWVAQWWQLWRREKGDAKTAARLVQADLGIAASWLQNMVEHDPRWYSFHDLRLPNWPERQAVLAHHLTSEQWESVSQSAIELAGTTAGFERAVGPNAPPRWILTLNDNQVASLRVMWEHASNAHRVLAKLADAKPEKGLLHEGAPARDPRPGVE
jgi:hypothetical protein